MQCFFILYPMLLSFYLFRPASRKRIFFVLALFLISLIFSSHAMAQGDLLIYPKRVVFDGTKRSQDISLANSGKDTARYKISVIEIRMKDDGSTETITQPDSGQYFADKNFRFFPRSVILGPKESQTIKIQLINFSQLAEGEYRSHLYFRAEPEEQPLGAPKKDSSLSIHLVPVYGISIPVIVRAGQSTTEMDITKASLMWEKDTLPVLSLDLNRSGNMSVYGDFTVDYLSPDGKETRVATVKGMALYTPNSVRHFRFLLDRSQGIDYHQGSLHVVFTDGVGKAQKVAQKQVYLP